MKSIQYSQQLLVDFDKLRTDFGLFMSLNLIHADKGLDANCQARMKELIGHSLKNNSKLVDLFEQPLLAHEQKNKEKLMKNMSGILKFMYDYLAYAGAILERCKPDIFNGRFAQIKKHYLNFYAKYFS